MVITNYLLSMFFFAFLLFFIGFINIIKTIQLRSYLKKNKYSRWEELTTIKTRFGDWGPGGGTLKSLGYLFNDIDNDDLNIHKLKKTMRIIIFIQITLVILIVIDIFAIFVIAYKSQM